MLSAWGERGVQGSGFRVQHFGVHRCPGILNPEPRTLNPHWLRLCLATLLWGLSVTFALPAAWAQSSITLTEATDQTGITFRHTDGSSGKKYLVEAVSAGLALFDYDADGDIDIYFLNGAPLKGTAVSSSPPQNALYRNDGDWKFTDVTDQAGVGDKGFGLGVAVGDYDNDGDPDLYLNNYGPNVMYRNNGDGTFTDVTRQAGVDDGNKVGAGTCFFDMDNDGDLDLYVANYIKFSYQTHAPPIGKGTPVYPGPKMYHGEPDTLYRNNGDGTFTDVSIESGIAAHGGRGMGMVCADYDDDGDTDVYVGNDTSNNFLFENDGDGKFEEMGLMAGVACNLEGLAQATMGVNFADFDNDGRLDFHATSYQKERATLYRNLGEGLFDDVTRISMQGMGTYAAVTWGNGLVDFDNDGDRDLFIACGHLHPNIEQRDDTTTYHTPNVLFENNGQGKFIDISKRSGNGMAVKLSSRGAAFDDLDNDGDLDVVILNSRREATILRNDTANDNHWIQIRLRGTKTNRDGVGARVTVTTGDLKQVDEACSGRGYQSHYGTRLHFGLGDHDRVDRIEVRWLGGQVDVVEKVPVDQILTITEGGEAK